MEFLARRATARVGAVRLLWLTSAALWLMVVGFGGCTLPRGGNLQQSCTSDEQCDDQNPCTLDRCSLDGFCEREADPFATPPQLAGDCLRAECDGEALVSVPADDPPDDDNPCTDDRCADGVVVHEPRPNGAICQAPEGMGQCNGGVCEVSCATVAECDDHNECTIDSCDPTLGICDHEKLHNVAAPLQTPEDCRIELCENGVVVLAVDNADLPDDDNDCTDDQCLEGMATHLGLPVGSACGKPADPLAKLCDAGQSCVQCLGASDCTHLPPNDDCQTRTCNAGVCGQSFTPLNTPVNASLQTPGDCKSLVCDGSGSMISIPLTSDLPVDNNPCTQDVCTGSTPSNPLLPPGSSCGAGLVCNATGSCVNCVVAADCGPDTFCLSWACVSQVCQAQPTANDMPLPQQTAMDCLEERCDGLGGVKSVAIFDPFVDGNECTDDLCLNGMPSNPPSAIDTLCTQGGFFCDGAGSCVECNQAGQCSLGDGVCESDQCLAHTCVIVDDPPGTPAPAGFQTSGDCHTVVCDGLGEVDQAPVVNDGDLPFDGQQCTDDVCTSGVPSNPPSPAETPCNEDGGIVCNGQSPAMCVECAGNAQCPAGQSCDLVSFSCKLDPGQGCGAPSDCLSGLCIDGVCCTSSCGGTCEACNLPAGPGTCLPVPFGQDPANECASGACDGAFGCGLDDGQACAAPSECLSGSCVDGVCCNSACAGSCEACNLAGSLGSCAFVPFGADPDGECAGGSCDGSGGCKLEAGEACLAPGECLSGFCSDGVCCGTACDGACEACDITPGICAPEPDGSPCDDGVFCNGVDSCQAGLCAVHGLDPCAAAIGDGDGDCSEACDEASQSCSAPEPDGTFCDDGLFCNGADSCLAGSCVSHAGDPCAALVGDGDADCQEACHEGLQMCVAPEPDGTFCDDGLFCTGVDSCQAGVCIGAGDPCPGPDGDADCKESCHEGMMSCTANDPNGSVCGPGLTCSGGNCN